MLAERLPLAFPSGHHDAGTGPMGSVLRKLIALKRLDLPTLFSPTITFIEGERSTPASWNELKLLRVILLICSSYYSRRCL